MIPVYFGSRRNLRDHLVFEEFCGQKAPETLVVLFNKLLLFGGAVVRDPRLLPLPIKNVCRICFKTNRKDQYIDRNF